MRAPQMSCSSDSPGFARPKVSLLGGCIFIDAVGNEHMATNVLTHERKQLPLADHWELVVDEDEGAFVGTFADGREPIILDYENVMTKKAFETDAGELMSRNLAQADAPATSLTAVCSKHRRGKLTLLPPMGSGGGFDLQLRRRAAALRQGEDALECE